MHEDPPGISGSLVEGASAMMRSCCTIRLRPSIIRSGQQGYNGVVLPPASYMEAGDSCMWRDGMLRKGCADYGMTDERVKGLLGE